MNIVIVGGGKLGFALAAQLSAENQDVAVIDSNAERIGHIANLLDVIALCGNGISHSVQEEAGTAHADLLIAATDSDETNMLCCMVAKKVGARHTIARVRSPEYHQQMFFLREELGLSLAINPDQTAAGEISRILRFPSAIKVEPFAKGRVELMEFRLQEDTPLDGVALYDLPRLTQGRFLICAVERGEDVTIPSGNFVLRAGDRLHIIVPPQDAAAAFKRIGAFKRVARDVLIVGGGRISYYLAQRLIESGIHVKIVERDAQRCNNLCELLPKATVIHGDGTDSELLQELGLGHIPAFVALTGIDEENIILSMYAKKQGVEKVITKLSKTSYVDMLGNSGLESFICPKDITSAQIVQYVRAMENSYGSNVETLYRIVHDRVEALEFHVRRSSKLIGVPFKDLSLKKNVLVGAIIRKNRCIIPGGGDSIEEGDSVIVITADMGLRELDSICREE